jgi:hypothetical protein
VRTQANRTRPRTDRDSELERLAELRAQHPRGVLRRADYELSLRRLGRMISDGAVSGLRRELASRHPAPTPPSQQLRFDAAVIDEMCAATSLSGYFTATHGGAVDRMAFPSFYRAYVAQVDATTRDRIKEAMAQNRSTSGVERAVAGDGCAATVGATTHT